MHDVSSYIISALPGTAGCLVRINYAAHMQGTFESKKNGNKFLDWCPNPDHHQNIFGCFLSQGTPLTSIHNNSSITVWVIVRKQKPTNQTKDTTPQWTVHGLYTVLIINMKFISWVTYTVHLLKQKWNYRWLSRRVVMVGCVAQCVERQYFAGELSLSCDRPAADGLQPTSSVLNLVTLSCVCGPCFPSLHSRLLFYAVQYTVCS